MTCVALASPQTSFGVRLSPFILEKEKGYQNVENTSDNESNNEESSSDIENEMNA